MAWKDTNAGNTNHWWMAVISPLSLEFHRHRQIWTEVVRGLFGTVRSGRKDEFRWCTCYPANSMNRQIWTYICLIFCFSLCLHPHRLWNGLESHRALVGNSPKLSPRLIPVTFALFLVLYLRLRHSFHRETRLFITIFWFLLLPISGRRT